MQVVQEEVSMRSSTTASIFIGEPKGDQPTKEVVRWPWNSSIQLHFRQKSIGESQSKRKLKEEI
jgi:hypothetical protein